MALNFTYPTDTDNVTLNGVFGKNIFSIYNSSGTTNYARINNTTNSPGYTLASVRQSTNTVGYSHFDISSFLQNDFTYYNQLETISKCFNHKGYEEQRYLLYAGYISGVSEVPVDVTQNFYFTIPARKNYYELILDYDQYIIDGEWVIFNSNYITYNPSVKSIALTDYPTYEREITLDEDYTLTFISGVPKVGTPYTEYPLTDFWFRLYDEDDVLLDDFTITNIESNGGVLTSYPTDAGDAVLHDVQYRLGTVSIGCGKSNTTLQSYITLNPTIKYYTVCGAFGIIPPEGGGTTPSVPKAVTESYKFTLGECDGRDYNHVQLSWVNSLGFRDYFTFTKKNVESLNIKRNTFQRQEGSWNSNVFVVNEEERGLTQYNSEVTQNYSLQTRFITDEENEYLKNLLISPDVKMRFEGEDIWYPVNITTNTWTQRRYRTDKLYQLNINVQKAHKIITQNNQ